MLKKVSIFTENRQESSRIPLPVYPLSPLGRGRGWVHGDEPCETCPACLSEGSKEEAYNRHAGRRVAHGVIHQAYYLSHGVNCRIFR